MIGRSASWNDRRGAFSIGFALLVPLMVALILAGIELGTQVMTATLLDSALRDASRFGVTGELVPLGMETNPPASREVAIRRIVLDRGRGWIIDARLDPIRLTAHAGHAAIGTPAAVAGAGSGGQVVVYEATYRAPVSRVPETLFGVSEILHRSRIVVRNEPFTAP